MFSKSFYAAYALFIHSRFRAHPKGKESPMIGNVLMEKRLKKMLEKSNIETLIEWILGFVF